MARRRSRRWRRGTALAGHVQRARDLLNTIVPALFRDSSVTVRAIEDMGEAVHVLIQTSDASDAALLALARRLRALGFQTDLSLSGDVISGRGWFGSSAPFDPWMKRIVDRRPFA